MGYTTCIISALLLAGSSTVNAENWNLDPAAPDVTHEKRWRVVTPDMSRQEFMHATHQNKRHVVGTLRTYSENAITSIGISRKNIALMGTAIGLVTQTTRFHLDDRKMLALEFKDITDGDRALYFGINIDW